MKKIADFTAYVFFIVAGMVLLAHLNVGPFVSEQKRVQTKFDPHIASTYSAKQAQQIIESDQKLRSEELVLLLKDKLIAEAPAETEAPDQKVCKDCREAVALLKSERDERIQAKNENKKTTIITFVSTLIVGLLIFGLKHNGWGPKLIKKKDTRESTVSFIEFAFAIWILAIGVIF